MTDVLDWEIVHCAGFIVPPCKNMDEHEANDEIRGSSLNVEANPVVARYFKPLFESVFEDCQIPVRFISENGEQQNKIRTLVRQLAFSTIRSESDQASRELALKLALASDHRSQKGLFISASGYSKTIDKYQVVLWKFPSDESIQAILEETGISIQLIEGAFSRSTKYFKAAVFRDVEADKSFWEGLVEDRQSNQKVHEGSKFWIEDFLCAQPNLTSVGATKLLAKALRETINNEQNYAIQDGIISAATTVKSQADRLITFREFSENYLPESAREEFEKKLGSVITLELPFHVDRETLEEQIGVRTIILRVGEDRINVTAPVENFNRDVQVQDSNQQNDETSQIIITGHIIGGKVSTSRSLK